MYTVQELLEISKKCNAIRFVDSHLICDLFFDTYTINHNPVLLYTIGRKLKEIISGCDELVMYDDNFLHYFNVSLSKFSIECPICSSRIVFSLKDRVLSELSSTISCFEKGYKTFTFKTKSDKFVILNDVRKYTTVPNLFIKHRINSLLGEYEVIKEYSSHDVLTFYVGNTSTRVYKLHEDYYFTSKFNEENIDIHPDKFDIASSTQLGSICCDLWWIMGIDKSEIDFEAMIADKVDYCVIDVVPDSTYQFTVNMNCDGHKLGAIFKLEKL